MRDGSPQRRAVRSTTAEITGCDRWINSSQAAGSPVSTHARTSTSAEVDAWNTSIINGFYHGRLQAFRSQIFFLGRRRDCCDFVVVISNAHYVTAEKSNAGRATPDVP